VRPQSWVKKGATFLLNSRAYLLRIKIKKQSKNSAVGDGLSLKKYAEKDIEFTEKKLHYLIQWLEEFFLCFNSGSTVDENQRHLMKGVITPPHTTRI
jgi:hypothetical protein